MSEAIRVLLADDSPWVRRELPGALARGGEIEFVGFVIDALVAEKKLPLLRPDVLLLDLHMPRADSFEVLRRLQTQFRVPTIVIHPGVTDGSDLALHALHAGAFDVFAKPERGPLAPATLAPLRRKILQAARFSPNRCPAAAPTAPTPVPAVPIAPRAHPHDIILIGASTGGTEAIAEILPQFPPDSPGICIVQHIPPVFSKSFAERLDRISQLTVREACDGDLVEPGVVLVAPGDYHMVLHRAVENGYRVRLHQGPRAHHQRPAVDELFSSGAKIAGKRARAALLTGMGRDGAAGMTQLRAVGARTFAQDAATCVVFGMPQAAWEIGAAERLLPLSSIPAALLQPNAPRRPSPALATA